MTQSQISHCMYFSHLFRLIKLIKLLKDYSQDLFGSPVDKNPPANAGDMGLIPRLGRFHKPWSN